MALHRPREPTHCTSLGGRGQAKDGKQWNKVELVFLMHMISIMPTNMDPFSVSASQSLTSVYTDWGYECQKVVFSCSSLPRLLTEQSMGWSEQTVHLAVSDWCALQRFQHQFAQLAHCFMKDDFFHLPLFASRQNGMKRVHSNSNNSIIIYYRVNGHEDYI